jgi:hypothetical protein
MHSGFGPGTGFGPRSSMKCNTKVKKSKIKCHLAMLLLALKRQDFVEFLKTVLNKSRSGTGTGTGTKTFPK